MTDRQTPQTPERPSKKTEAVEVRMSPEDKAAFMAACAARGEAASEVLRGAMRRYVSGPPRAGRILMAVSIPGAAGAALFAAAALTPAAPPPEKIETAVELVLVGGQDTGHKSTSVTASGELVRIILDDVAADDLEPVFGPLAAEAVTLVMTFTPSWDSAESVVYDVTLDARTGDAELLAQRINPVLTVGHGEPASIVLANEYPGAGFSKGLSVTLTPSPGA